MKKKTRPKKRAKKKLSKKKAAKKPIRKAKRPIKKKVKKTARKSKKALKRLAKKIAKKRKIVRKKVAKKRPVKKVVRKRPVKRTKKKIVKKKAAKKRVVKPKKTRRKPKAIRRPARKRRVVKKKRVVKKRRPVRKAKKRVIKRRVVKRKKVVRKTRRIIRKRHRKVKTVRRSYSGGGPLEQLFESPAKVQIMKLFFRNPETNFLLKEAAKIMRSNLSRVRKEIKRLEKIGLLKSRRISSHRQIFSINPNFDFFNELKELILKASPVSKEQILKAARRLGKVKLVLLSGIFMGNEMSRADLLIVGDNINQRRLNIFIKNLEAEAGTDISCVVMTTKEFNYRYDMYDRFVRDLLNEKCEFLINRLRF